MNGAELHLLINHLPVLVPVIGTALIALGLTLKSREHCKVGAWLLVLGALSAIPVYLTGKPAERVVKNYPDISRLLIHDHQEAAWTSLILMEFSGALGVFVLWASRDRAKLKPRTWMWGLLLAASAASFVLMARTAHLGGLIRHEEIRTTDRF